ncbi:MAG: DUF4203 domain-containing protein [Chloroflexi bacterium]|nr:DUF4203 domain-containing protein [Chloroflexota bacterium]
MDDSTLILVTGLVTLGFGILNTFFGYQVFRLSLSIVGFLIGAGIGLTLAAQNPDTQSAAAIFGLVGGLLGGVLMYFVFLLSVLVAGAIFGLAVASIVLTLLNLLDNNVVVILGLGLGVLIGGMISLSLRKQIIILSTAFGGAASLIAGVLIIVPTTQMGTASASANPQLSLEVFARSLESLQANPSLSLVAFLIWVALGTVGWQRQYRNSAVWRAD